MKGSFRLVSVLRIASLAFAVVLTGIAVFLWVSSTRTELAYRYSCDLPAASAISAECLEEVPVPVNRHFETVTDKGMLVSSWTRHTVYAGEMTHASQLMHEPPKNFRFGAGTQLPDGAWGYFLPLPPQLLAVINPGNQLSLSFAQPDREQLIVVMDHAAVYEKLLEPVGGVYVALMPDQVAAVERLMTEVERLQQMDAADIPPEELIKLVWTVDQPANDDLPPLAVYELSLQEESLP
jgi:hypothetical protein